MERKTTNERKLIHRKNHRIINIRSVCRTSECSDIIQRDREEDDVANVYTQVCV